MPVLYFLESIRNPVLDFFFATITHLGAETIMIVLAVIFFWCIDKKQGYYLLTVGFVGTICNQFLKMFFRIPRPWVKDPAFTIVEAARGDAVGYSFPSGHAQSSVGVFGSVARWSRRKGVRIVCLVLCVLVPFSRMYLGVHTLLDVGVSVVLAVGLLVGLQPLIDRCFARRFGMRAILLPMTALAAALVAYVAFAPFPADVDPVHLRSSIENACKLLGSCVGICVAYELDEHYTHFETSARLPAQICKVIGGMLPILLIKVLLKEPLHALMHDHPLSDALRYFLLVVFAGGIWPMTFGWLSRRFEKTPPPGTKGGKSLDNAGKM